MMKPKCRNFEIQNPIEGIKLLIEGLFSDVQIVLNSEDQNVLSLCANFIAWTKTLHEKPAEAILEALIERLGSKDFLGVDDPTLAHEASQLNSELVAAFKLHRDALIQYRGVGVDISHIHEILSHSERLEARAMIQINLCRLQKNTLEHLELRTQDLELIPGEMQGLLAMLKGNTSLKGLIFTEGLLDVNQLRDLAEFLENNTLLRSLRLNGCLKGQDLSPLLRALGKNSALKYLDLSRNELSDEAGVAIVELLKENSTLEKLVLRSNYLDDKTITAIADALKSNCALRKLDISDNGLSQEGIVKIIDVLKLNTRLESLISDDNWAGDNIGTLLADSLGMNRTLSELSLAGNEDIDDKALIQLLRPLQARANTSLTALNLMNCSLAFKGLAQLIRFLDINPPLVELGFSWVLDQRSEAVIQGAIIKIVMKNTNLKILNLARNQFDDRLIPCLINALKLNKNLESFHMMCLALKPAAIKLFRDAWIEGLPLMNLFFHPNFYSESEADPDPDFADDAGRQKIYHELFKIIYCSRLFRERHLEDLALPTVRMVLDKYSGFDQAQDKLTAIEIEDDKRVAAAQQEEEDMEDGPAEHEGMGAGSGEDEGMGAGAGQAQPLPIAEVPASLGALAMCEVFKQDGLLNSGSKSKFIGFKPGLF